MQSHTLFGVEFSYYSAKTRSYLLHKRIPFVEQANAWSYMVVLPRRVKVSAVPVVVTPDGEWLQDTSEIFDALEKRFPQPPGLPATPVLRIAAYLFELWGDEFFLALAMHTRWNRPEHWEWWIGTQAGPALLPGWPKIMQRWLAGRLSRDLRGHAPTMGFETDQAAVLDRFAAIQLDGLDAHFARHPFLFGGRPSLGDYGLIGPLYAHIGRDPLSKRDLIDTRPNLKAWIERMFQPESSSGGEFLADDSVPDTLLPALRSIFDEMLPYVGACAAEVRKSPVLPAGTRKAPRFLGTVSYPMAGSTHRRAAASNVVWMAQRLLEAFHGLPVQDQQRVRDWLAEVGGEDLLELDLPAVRRVGLAAAHIGAGLHPPV